MLHFSGNKPSTPGPTVIPDTLLLANQGLFIGDKHNDVSIRQHLASELAKLSDAGVRTLYLEMLPAASQPEIDRFSKSPTKANQLSLYQALSNHWGWGSDTLEENMNLISVAQKLGIRMVGIDADAISAVGREKAWEDTIRNDRATHGEGRYVIFAGKDHESRFGLASLLNIPSFNFEGSATNTPMRDKALVCSSAPRKHLALEMPTNEREFKKTIAYLEKKEARESVLIERLTTAMNKGEMAHGVDHRHGKATSYKVFDKKEGWCGKIFKCYADLDLFDEEIILIGVFASILSAPVWVPAIVAQPLYTAGYRGIAGIREKMTDDPVAEAETDLIKIFKSRISHEEKEQMLKQLVTHRTVGRDQIHHELDKVKEAYEERYMQKLTGTLSSPKHALMEEILDPERIVLISKEPISTAIQRVDGETMDEVLRFLSQRENRRQILTLELTELPGSDPLSLSINHQLTRFLEIPFEERQIAYAELLKELQNETKAYREFSQDDLHLAGLANMDAHLSLSTFAGSLSSEEAQRVMDYLQQPSNQQKILSGRVEQQSGSIESAVTILLDLPSAQRRSGIQSLISTISAGIELHQGT